MGNFVYDAENVGVYDRSSGRTALFGSEATARVAISRLEEHWNVGGLLWSDTHYGDPESR
ncbi:hypothetical protein ACSBPH_01765 [Microbacterium sp. F51-2R]|uniref:hypothetical protein n=1 Tax=Microbacterium sp. F51-2R TaxID=3445777 RepID=UPI003FA034FA